MTTAAKWSNVGVAIQSALSAPQTIDSISKAATGVVTYQGADPVNGDYVLLSVQGMHQVDARVFRVANVNAGGNTFEIEGENTAGYDTFSSGTLQVITFGTTLATATALTASGGDFSFVDITTIHDAIKKQIPGLAEPAVYTFENIWDVSDAGLQALKAAADNQAQRAVRFSFATGAKVLFTGYIGCTLLPVGSAPDVVKTPSVITMVGRPTVYSS